MHHSTIVDKSVHGCRNWYFLVRQNLDTLQCNHFSGLDISIPKSTLWRCVYNKMTDNFKQEWNVSVTQPNSRNGQGRNKLPTVTPHLRQNSAPKRTVRSLCLNPITQRSVSFGAEKPRLQLKLGVMRIFP